MVVRTGTGDKGCGDVKEVAHDVVAHHPEANVAGILEKGFEPRQRGVPGTSRRYAPRIYLGTSEQGIRGFAKGGDDWVLMKVDRSKLPKGQKSYVDQEFGNRSDGSPVAVFTMDPIPASAVSMA